MRNHLHRLIIILLLSLIGFDVHAQQVNTLYFLENAPMRHVINPAIQPINTFYMTIPFIGHNSLWVGNNGLALNKFVFNQDGKTITVLHPNAESKLWKRLPKILSIDADLHIDLLSLGFRIQDNGYAHINISERVTIGAGLPKTTFGILFDQNLNDINLSALNASASMYTDIALGYSHRLNEQWVVGGKLKILLGQAYIGGQFKHLDFSSSERITTLKGNGRIMQAGILKDIVAGENIQFSSTQIKEYLKPVGYGGAIDLGMTYKPLQYLQVTASVTDLGIMCWSKASVGSLSIDTTFTGLANFNYSDYVYSGEFRMDSLKADISHNLQQYTNALHMSDITDQSFCRMLNANINIGVDANFWENRIGVGVYSRTRFHNKYVSEEITLGAAIRPYNWLNFALSYSFLNGKWSNLGSAISIATYDGFMLTLAADYIPLSYVTYPMSDQKAIHIPYRTKGFNLSFGFAIVTGTNSNKKRIDKDKDGVFYYMDLCLNTPYDIQVDTTGCSLDTDGDAIPDYMDECPNTSADAYEMIDSVGCPIDADLDGVSDHIDLCPNTTPEARNYVDEHGCVLDSDGDGVADYLDQCPGTPVIAYTNIDEFGCPIDMDEDGVADYMDLCPNTPIEARPDIGEDGCPIDTDEDGIYDYQDLCPTIAGVQNASGCPEVKKEVRFLFAKAMTEIQFENGKSIIKPSSYSILNQLAKAFIDNPIYIIEIQGHTDNIGNYQYNVELSKKRAQAVRDYLIKQGVPINRLTTHGYGSDRPITDNSTKEGRQQNQRIEFMVTFR